MYKIAICDDDKNYREKIEKVIETEGILPKSEIRFYEYESGKELLENADILHDLVFMDMRMPGLDGNKSVLKLREYNRAAILVFCSGYFEPTPDSINSAVDSLMSWNYQSVEKILNQLTKMHFRTAKLSETLLLAIKAR